MNQEQLDKCAKQLRSRMPFLGAGRRRAACAALAADGTAAAVPLLVEALGLGDAEVRASAEAALRGLKDPGAVDALCGLWAESRDGTLGRIIAERGYVAAQPVDVRVLSALQADKGASVAENPAALQELVTALQDGDQTLAGRADRVLRGLADPKARAALCRLAVADLSGAAAKICVACGYRPGDPEELALYLFVTRQLEEYFKEDFEFQNLRLAYDRAAPPVQAAVMEVVRSGDRRCLGFFGKRKPLSECSEGEILLAIDSGMKHRDWQKLFDAFLQLPLKYSYPLLEEFRTSGWEPEDEELRNLYRQVLEAGKGQAVPAVKTSDATSSLFDRWLAQPATGTVEELLERLKTANPPEAVAIVAALARLAEPGSPASEAVRTSEHWLVRLAGYQTGLCQNLDLSTDTGAKDGNHWVSALAGCSALLDFWPGRATPADLDALQSAPREAWAGRFGAVRRVLQLLLAYRTTTGEFDEIEIEAGEFAGEFEEA